MAIAALPLVCLFSLVFLTVHILVYRSVKVYPRAFQISRGVAAVVLTGVGVIALLYAKGAWNTAFLYAHSIEDPLLFLMTIVMGHFLSDFLWMAWGKQALAISPRPDLLIHHGIGMISYGIAFCLLFGGALALIVMMSELMPVVSGLTGWAKFKGNRSLEILCAKWRIRLLVWWRGPLWLVLIALLIRTKMIGGFPEPYSILFWLILPLFFFLLGLDEFWIRRCLEAERRQAEKS
jgi:hypothetical protein